MREHSTRNSRFHFTVAVTGIFAGSTWAAYGPAEPADVPAIAAPVAAGSTTWAGEPPEDHEPFVVLPEIVVRGRADNLVGVASTSSTGRVGRTDLAARPLLRAGEIAESVPGVVISQHSGAGKGNQFYARGFNLDHGTDFAFFLDGVPVNLPSHAHGQGYTDLNGIMPELVESVEYEKGPYRAGRGDFATAGAANLVYADSIPGMASVTGGAFGYGRGFFAASPALGDGRFLYAFEAFHQDGPWQRREEYLRWNGLLKYSAGDRANGWAVTASSMQGRWYAADQVPLRAVTSGALNRFGTVDPSDGGRTWRHTASARWARQNAGSDTTALLWGGGYGLNLFSNFTYASDPVNGDQFEQADRRWMAGATVTHSRNALIAGRPADLTAGLDVRHDAVGTLGLYRTAARQRFATTSESRVGETSLSPWTEAGFRPLSKLRMKLGLRAEGYRFDVGADRAENSGVRTAGRLSPKLTAAVGPWADTEIYSALGWGHHSNDARGALVSVDPQTGAPSPAVTPLAGAWGWETGVRTAVLPGLQSTLTYWELGLASELIFVGDAGTVEAGRPSHRSGVEFANAWSPRAWVKLDADWCLSTARFTDGDPAGPHVPGSLRDAVTAGLTFTPSPVSVGGRLRYFGSRPLIEDGSVRSDGSLLVSGRVSLTLRRGQTITLDGFNLLDTKADDVAYYYESRLQGEPAAVADLHTHPAEPRQFRLTFASTF